MTSDRDATARRLAKLESDVAAALNHHDKGEIQSVRLAQGEEEADVASAVDLFVRRRGGAESLFTILSLSAITRFLSDEAIVRASGDFYTSGGPLIIVQQMSADVIARGIFKYLRMEGPPEC